MTIAHESPTVVPSLRDIRDKDPYVAYPFARQTGNVVWDEGRHAWPVLDYEGCAMVERGENLLAERTAIRPIINARLSRIRSLERAELWTESVDQIVYGILPPLNNYGKCATACPWEV